MEAIEGDDNPLSGKPVVETGQKSDTEDWTLVAVDGMIDYHEKKG